MTKKQSTSGFIYIWYDHKRKMFYIGSHWGVPDDGYICSSKWMRDAYRYRTQDFKRRILKTITTTRKDLFLEEERWLQMIKPLEVGKRYYNLHLTCSHHWNSDPSQALSVSQKLSKSTKEQANTPEFYKRYTKERNEKISATKLSKSTKKVKKPKIRKINITEEDLQKKITSIVARSQKTFKITTPTKEELIITNLSQFCRDYSFPTSTHCHLTGKYGYKGYHAILLPSPTP